MRRTSRLIARTLGAIVLVWALLVGVSSKIVQFTDIPSPSMSPTLRVGDDYIVDRWVGGADLHRGDIVEFHQPPHWQPPALHRGTLSQWWHVGLRDIGLGQPDATFVKRVIGLPGDRVVCKAVRGGVFLNGHLLADSYVKDGVGCDAPYDITVPAGHLWVLGDNRTHSADSAWWDEAHHGAWGSVPFGDVVGRIGPRVYRR